MVNDQTIISDKEGHVVPLPELKHNSRSQQKLDATEINKTQAKKNRLDQWAHQNKKRALNYLRARRHYEHDRRYDGTLPEFNTAPPVGMERLARTQVDCEHIKLKY